MMEGARIDADRRAAMYAGDLWQERVLTDYLDVAVAASPKRVAITHRSSSTGAETRLTYLELAECVRRVAAGLMRLGVAAGDVVAYQLPNCWQFGVLHLACVRIGAISNPLMPIFRQRELRFMLEFGEAKVLVVPDRFRDFDYPSMVADIRSDLPQLEQVLVIDGKDENSFESHCLIPSSEDAALQAADYASRRPNADQVTQLLYTSGTTGQPKGVLHTGNTLLAAARSCITHLNLTAEEVILMASPLAHQTGFVYGLVLPLVLGARSVLQEIWSPRIAAQWIEDESVSFTMAATPFLADMAQSSELEGFNFSSFRTFVSAGAPIPRVIARQAADRLGAHIASGWGMTENSLVTTTRREDPEEKVFETDGLAHEGMEVRIRDATGGLAGVGVEGWLESRGAAQFVGYLKKPDLAGFDVEGWFETGDLATMDADGYIRITGRTKDVIIRGGENIPVVEVEELLYQHPHVSAAAIVGMPDERLGERACCFLILSAGATLSFEEMIEYLLSQGLTKTYLPERLEIVSEMPRTPSGKIQKFHLRETLQR